jgi:glycerol transport system ATP-binding protein
MAKITFKNIGHTYNKSANEEDWALKPINMQWETGRSYALVGPSGCGKTTILNIISGIVKPYQGQILFDDADVTKLPISKRNVAQVFQFPTIYKSMTVFENLSFPLVCRDWEKDKIRERVGDVAEQIGISHKLDRSANKLGADEKQLISLGRGLVRDDVTALLMDEPLTVIDPQLKFELRKRIKQIIQGKNITVVYVTHDQYEAMTFADELLVMSLGRLVQQGTPEELFEKPNSKYVGNFIGSPAMNFLRGKNDGGTTKVGDQKLVSVSNISQSHSSDVELGIRPEHVSVVDNVSENVIVADFISYDDIGSSRILNCKFDSQAIRVKIPRGHPVPNRGKINLKLPKEKLLTYQDGMLL